MVKDDCVKIELKPKSLSKQMAKLCFKAVETMSIIICSRLIAGLELSVSVQTQVDLVSGALVSWMGLIHNNFIFMRTNLEKNQICGIMYI